MVYINRVFLAGNLTRDPEVRYLPSGKAVADLQLAINRRFKTAAGEEKEDTCFVTIAVWGRQAETAGEYLKKGSNVLIEGSLRYEKWESNGEKRSRLSVTADHWQFLDRVRRGGEGGGAPAGGRTAGGRPPDRAEEPPPAPAAEPADEHKPEESKADDDNLPF